MKISVAMCTYNGARFLREELDSIARQTRLPDELIVCDDASTDNTVEILQDFAASAPFPVHLSINETNLGVMRNFEQSVSLCSGDLIALSDSDDVWHADKLEALEQLALQAPEVGLIFTDAEVVDSELQSLKLKLSESVGFDERKQAMVRRGQAFDILLSQSLVTGTTMAFRKELREIALPFPSSATLYHDGWIALVVAPITRFGFINRPTIKYRVHSDQCVGIQLTNTTRRVLTASRTSPEVFVGQAVQFQEAYNRLSGYPGKFIDEHALAKLEEKLSHLKVRATMPVRRVFRIRPVVRELLNRHYHRYSRGWYSAGKDLFV
jgi:glycosyltransferase involved in cell wall biosynthesis